VCCLSLWPLRRAAGLENSTAQPRMLGDLGFQSRHCQVPIPRQCTLCGRRLLLLLEIYSGNIGTAVQTPGIWPRTTDHSPVVRLLSAMPSQFIHLA